MRRDVLTIGESDVRKLLDGRELELLELVARAYMAHGQGRTALPHSTFLRFPGDDVNRIIALPAYLGGDGFEVAGMKWIASFPTNLEEGLPRASAILILNSCTTGRPEAILEGSLISACRTAASAALGARELVAGREPDALGLVGTGLINREIARFVRAALPSVGRLVLFDLDRERAAAAAEELEARWPGLRAEVADRLEDVLGRCPVTSFATTAVRPHVDDFSICPQGAVVLHVSLRDLTPEAILSADNVVDDPDHVSRAGTSIHQTEQQTGSRDFIRCTIADLLEGTAKPKDPAHRVSVFSPFGLGILDLALGADVARRARDADLGTLLPSFLPV